ncbi:MAG: peptide-methionine (S)-S-oxide reductase MsrA [Pirellulaceae bacterium]|nr:peptide-methionine (S)-S-oxide reductase MsrA [Pirellulaceae bacterium]MDP6553600.1 peptide-methionine (S)-S-oxide reductase MsrA [Pirellulaceae bacterium]
MSRITTCLIGMILACLQLGCHAEPVPLSLAVEEPVAMAEEANLPTPDPKPAPAKVAVATFGAGCFWCTEAVFLRLDGVTAVESGYAGGFVKNPTYNAVCAGETGHAEVCRISYDPDKIGYDELLKVFWMTHDPTTLNQQGADRGTQYRSVVFHHDETQKELATKFKKELDELGAFPAPIVTEISPLKEYYKAEEYHQNYFEQNPFQGYCQAVVRPKIAKFEKVFKDKLKATP